MLTFLLFILLILVVTHFIRSVRLERKNNSISSENTPPAGTPPAAVSTIVQAQRRKVTLSPAAELAEMDVDKALRGLSVPRYFVFRDLIVPSYSRDLSLTQIDHVVVSQYGIFCIETKSHHGAVYGYSRSVKVDGVVEDMTPSGVVRKINNHDQSVYDLATVEVLAKKLAHAATFRETLRDRHATEVRAYVDARVAATLRYS